MTGLRVTFRYFLKALKEGRHEFCKHFEMFSNIQLHKGFIARRRLSRCSKEVSTFTLVLKRKEKESGCVFVRCFQEFHSKLNKRISMRKCDF